MSTEILSAIEASNKAFADFKTLNDARLDNIEKNRSRGDELNESMKRAFADISSHRETIERLEAKLTNRPGNGGATGSDKETSIAEHRKAFGGYMRKGTDFDRVDMEAKALDITNANEGGYAVPKVIDSSIESLVVNISPIRSIASVQQISTSDFHKLVNLRGTASGWVAETAARPETAAPTLADVVPPMGELYANPQATQQMLDDVFFNAEAWLAENVALEFARAEGLAFVSGNGTAKPKGFLSYTNVTTDDTTRAFGSVQYCKTGAAADWATTSASVSKSDVLVTMIGALKAAYRQNATWVLPKSILFDIAAMKDNSARYIFNPMSAPGIPQTILNYPIVEAEDMPAKGANAYSVAFGDFRRAYLIVDRIGTRVLRDPFSNKPYVGFYTTKRLGGALVNSEAIKLLKFEA